MGVPAHWQGTFFASPADVRAYADALVDPAWRLRFAVARVRRCAKLGRDHVTSRAILLAGQLLDLPYTLAQRLFRDIGDTEDPTTLEWAVNAVGPLRRKHVGHVYFISPDDDSPVMKVGFARDPVERIKAVERFYGFRAAAVGSHAGTMLDEHTWHCRADAYRIVDEWFFNWTEVGELQEPAFLLRYRGRGDVAAPKRITVEPGASV